MFGGGELSELEKATMTVRVSQRRATIPEPSRYCKVYARNGACALTSASKATTTLSVFRFIWRTGKYRSSPNPITQGGANRFVFLKDLGLGSRN
jgi:hypothetical protein